MATKAVRRSTTFKQFLLRVHPDHFRVIPKVHDENLQSIQLLNQFMDEQRAFAPGHYERKRVFFSAYVPPVDGGEPQQPTLKRFRLDLATNIEDHMKRILRECGVQIPQSETLNATKQEGPPIGRSRNTRDFDGDYHTSSSESKGGMDFGFNAHFAQYMHTRKRKRPIVTMAEFLEFVNDQETQHKQLQIRHAWESIQSVKRTLVREFKLREVSTSCGWASLPLNATLMILLKTLRKLNGVVKLDGVRLDVRADSSEIDYFDEYTVVLNVADVPLQWVELLEKIDLSMLASIQIAYDSLQLLQQTADRALGGGISIVRGRTCSALAFRGFLQDVAATAPLYCDDPMRLDNYHNDAMIEKLTVVVEDSARECEILEDGRVRVPSSASASHVLEFLGSHRSDVRDQLIEFDSLSEQFDLVAKQCVAVMGLKSLTYAEGLRLSQANRACTRLLSFASNPVRSVSAAAQASNGDLLQTTNGKHFRIDRFFGLAQDGVFTIPVDW